ncbi:histidine phosphatase family protein [Streptosporangium roseum]|uniref:Phosphoglycerate mutase n=1 Tax=Streptosporangium roseum (strain ATCC 12428 / DSM 43021 / JCM 3005 / KCTC 9067 / NCIMB 10171 / NRRL 2505 / NI 9100) TaxID=479432 RepID=D2AYV1_STRRD|nr:histidine phosphatase family protein [Streptosporangium roseum]ACZ90888.1 putative phosphoglycerate mutase [Streptosporangium roseum DSM 43021]
MTIFLSRHGRTEWSVQGRYAGVSDIPLDEVGREQALLLADWARGAGLTGVVSSPLLRARDTAADAARAAGLTLRTDPRLRELDFGDAEGLHRAEVEPEAMRRFQADPVADFLPGGEDPVEAAERVTRCLLELDEAGRTLVVAHNTILRLALCGLLGIPLADYRRRLPLIEHGSVTELTLGPAGPALRRFNSPIR